MSEKSLVLCELPAPVDAPVETWSPFCLKVRRALNHAGFAYTTRHEHDPAAYAELNPAQQVPILVADGQPVVDSTVILATLRDWQGLPPASAEAILYEELADTALNGFLLAARWAEPENWARVRPTFFGPLPEAIVKPMRAGVIQALVGRDIWRAGPAACWARFEILLDALDARAPTEGFWLGDTPGAADFALFGQLRSLRLPLTPTQAAAIRRRARLDAWIDRVDAATRA